MIKMYGFWRSAASFRVRIALNLKGLAYEETMVDLDVGDQYVPAYKAINPQAAVPSWIRHWFREGLVQGEAKLADDPATGRFCHGDTPSIADLCLISQVMGARGFKVDITDLPTVNRIAEACLAIDAFARAQPLRQPGAPASH
jgi:glutathione S-transferase